MMNSTLSNLQVGDKVVYPNHGVGVIEQISSRTLGTQVERFYLLKIKASSLKVMVPFTSIGNVGLRRVVKNGEVQKILDFLTDGECSNNTDWKYRFKENSDKMRTGSLMEVAVVLKGLLLLSQTTPLSFRAKHNPTRSTQSTARLRTRCFFLRLSHGGGRVVGCIRRQTGAIVQYGESLRLANVKDKQLIVGDIRNGDAGRAESLQQNGNGIAVAHNKHVPGLRSGASVLHDLIG
jgi:CarD family transcriptional regulator